jgi:repressor of nif and glnA expression
MPEVLYSPVGLVGEGMTRKQAEIMRVIFEAHKANNPIDLDELLDSISYETTKSSMQYSIRALIFKGWIEKGEKFRKGRSHVTYRLTQRGETIMKPATLSVEPPDMESLSSEDISPIDFKEVLSDPTEEIENLLK